jgi:fluoride ion exporter CrcB/FEX
MVLSCPPGKLVATIYTILVSTFSTFSFETLVLFKTGQIWWGIANVIFSVAITVTLLWYLIYKSQLL